MGRQLEWLQSVEQPEQRELHPPLQHDLHPESIDLELRRLPAISGRMLLASGRPLANAKVTVGLRGATSGAVTASEQNPTKRTRPKRSSPILQCGWLPD